VKRTNQVQVIGQIVEDCVALTGDEVVNYFLGQSVTYFLNWYSNVITFF